MSRVEVMGSVRTGEPQMMHVCRVCSILVRIKCMLVLLYPPLSGLRHSINGNCAKAVVRLNCDSRFIEFDLSQWSYCPVSGALVRARYFDRKLVQTGRASLCIPTMHQVPDGTAALYSFCINRRVPLCAKEHRRGP